MVFTGTADFKCDLVSQKAPIYRGVATSVSDLQRCQRGLLTRACTSDLCLEQRSVGEGRRATAACIGWSAPWWSAPWCLRRGVCAVVAACIGWSAYWMVTRTQGQCMNNAYGLCGGAVTPKSYDWERIINREKGCGSWLLLWKRRTKHCASRCKS